MARPSVQLVGLVVLSTWLLAPARAADPQAPRATPTPTPTPTPRSPGASKPKAGATAKPSEPEFRGAREEGGGAPRGGAYRRGDRSLSAGPGPEPRVGRGTLVPGHAALREGPFAEARAGAAPPGRAHPRVGAGVGHARPSEFRRGEYAQRPRPPPEGPRAGLGSNEALIQVTRYHTAILLTRFGGLSRTPRISWWASRARGPTPTSSRSPSASTSCAGRCSPRSVPAADRPSWSARAGRPISRRSVVTRRRGTPSSSLRREDGEAPGVAETYRDFLAAYPKALSDPALREQALRRASKRGRPAPGDFEADLLPRAAVARTDSGGGGLLLEKRPRRAPGGPRAGLRARAAPSRRGAAERGAGAPGGCRGSRSRLFSRRSSSWPRSTIA